MPAVGISDIYYVSYPFSDLDVPNTAVGVLASSADGAPIFTPVIRPDGTLLFYKFGNQTSIDGVRLIIFYTN